MAQSTLTTVLGVLTVISQIAVRLSPAPELYRVHKRKSTGVMAFMPLVSMLLSNHVWGLYGWVIDNMFPLFFVCVFGEIATTVQIFIYMRYCDDRMYLAKTLAVGLVPIFLVSVYFVLVESGVVRQSNDQFGLVLGYLADVTTFVLFFSPFEKIKQVIVTKSSAAIPLLMCIVICINSVLWFINGIADDDLFILVPNSVGIAITLVQITLYFIYRPGRFVAADGVGDDKIEVVVDMALGVKTPVGSPKSPVFGPLVSPLAPIKQ